MLKSILIITISVFNLSTVETAYHEFLDYDTVERGLVSAELGAAWNAPAMRDHDYVIMQPSSKAPVYLRFVEDSRSDDFAPMTTHGWSATELLVTDPDTLAKQLDDSPFEIIGAPKDLWQAPNAPRAMQVRSPGGEVLYLTRNGDFTTETFVDRVFIMVLGGPSMAAMSDFYREKFGLTISTPTPFPITVLSKAQGRSADTTYPLAIATVSKEFLLELDEYPADTSARPVTPGHLPPGTAMLTFEIDADLDDLDIEWRAPPRPIDAFPYDGRNVGVTLGAAGEWIELVGTASTRRSGF